MNTHRSCLGIICVLALAACDRAPPPAPAPAAVEEPQAPAAPTPPAIATMPAASASVVQPAPMPEGSYASYQCDDGTQVEVHFNGIAATVVWPDGRAAQLSQSATVADGQPQVYSDPAVRIERNSDGLQLREGESAPVHCTETEASA